MKFKAQYNKHSEKWFPRSISSGKTVTTKRLMTEVAKASTVAPADVAAVLQALSDAMCDHLCDGDKVKLDNIGTFYLMADASGNGVATEKEVTASQINRVNVRFAPEKVRVGGGGGNKNSIPALANGNITWERAESATEPSTTGGTTGGNTGGGTEPQTVAAPTISGTTPFATSTQVTITGPEGAEIRYTTNGSTPTAESTLYSAAFSLSATTTVKAIAIKDGVSSEVTTKTFTQSTGGESD